MIKANNKVGQQDQGPPPQAEYHAPGYSNQSPPGHSNHPPPPPGYGYQPPPPGQQQVVIINQQRIQFTDVPMTINCPHCRMNIVTRTEYVIGSMVWLIVGILFLMGIWCGCCLIPLCINSLKDVVHYCPSCNTEIGRKIRM